MASCVFPPELSYFPLRPQITEITHRYYLNYYLRAFCQIFLCFHRSVVITCMHLLCFLYNGTLKKMDFCDECSRWKQSR